MPGSKSIMELTAQATSQVFDLFITPVDGGTVEELTAKYGTQSPNTLNSVLNSLIEASVSASVPFSRSVGRKCSVRNFKRSRNLQHLRRCCCDKPSGQWNCYRLYRGGINLSGEHTWSQPMYVEFSCKVVQGRELAATALAMRRLTRSICLALRPMGPCLLCQLASPSTVRN